MCRDVARRRLGQLKEIQESRRSAALFELHKLISESRPPRGRQDVRALNSITLNWTAGQSSLPRSPGEVGFFAISWYSMEQMHRFHMIIIRNS